MRQNKELLLARKVLTLYGFGNARIKKIRMGVANYNYLVIHRNEKYVLRRITKTKKQLMNEFLFLDLLKEDGFQYSLPVPLPTLNGELYIELNGVVFWMYKYIEGDILERFHKKHVIQIAEMMAHYHSIIENDPRFKRLNSRVYNPLMVIRETKRLSKMKTKSRFFQLFSKYTNSLLSLLDKHIDYYMSLYETLEKYPIHRDICPENLVFNNDRLVGIIDFDDATRFSYPFISDFISFISYSFPKKRKYYVDIFLNEYNKHRRISTKEKKILPFLGVIQAVEDINYEYWLYLNDRSRARIKSMNHRFLVGKWFSRFLGHGKGIWL